MKKIALLFPYLRESGICKVPATHSRMFKQEGYEVDLIIRDDLVEYPYNGNIINLNIKTRIGLLKILTYIELFFKVYHLKKKKNYDVVISHTPHCNLINVLTKLKERVITTTHITNDFHNTIARMTLGYILKKSDVMVTVSKSLESSLKKQFLLFKHKIICIYNPVETELIANLADVPILEGNPYILNVGRLSKQKAHWSLIKAFSLIVNKYPDLILIILGEGSLKNQLMQLTLKLELSDKVLFKGFDNNPYRYMKNCELFVLPSLNEGFPLVLLEALATNTVILSSDCISGPREIISPKTSIDEVLNYENRFEYGYLYSNQDTDMNFDCLYISESDRRLAIAIDNALSDKSSFIKLKEKSRNRLESLSLEHIFKEWQHILST